MIDELYSARILKLAANMPHSGRLAAPQGTGERVAKLCGSKAVVDVVLDAAGRIEAFAQDVKACALGQAAAGVLGETVIGASADEIAAARDAMIAMLKSGGEGPEAGRRLPGPARLDHGRHRGDAGRGEAGADPQEPGHAN